MIQRFIYKFFFLYIIFETYYSRYIHLYNFKFFVNFNIIISFLYIFDEKNVRVIKFCSKQATEFNKKHVKSFYYIDISQSKNIYRNLHRSKEYILHYLDFQRQFNSLKNGSYIVF